MPSELQRVAHALLAALDETPRVVDYLLRTAQKCRENAAYVGQMSGNTAARTAAVQLDAAAQRCEEAARYLAQVPPKARGWVEPMVTGSRVTRPAPLSGSGPLPGSAQDDDRAGEGQEQGQTSKADGGKPGLEGGRPSPPISEEDAWGLFRKLPVRVERRGHREKTTGLWRDADGNEKPILSGIDQHREMADRLALDKKLGDPPHTLAISSHVEIKFALMMRERGLTDETIVVNKRPCDGDLGCDQMLSRFLPAGGSLTVYGPAGFRRTYRSTEQDG
jgi:hypothetical protein